MRKRSHKSQLLLGLWFPTDCTTQWVNYYRGKLPTQLECVKRLPHFHLFVIHVASKFVNGILEEMNKTCQSYTLSLYLYVCISIPLSIISKPCDSVKDAKNVNHTCFLYTLSKCITDFKVSVPVCVVLWKTQWINTFLMHLILKLSIWVTLPMN